MSQSVAATVKIWSPEGISRRCIFHTDGGGMLWIKFCFYSLNAVFAFTCNNIAQVGIFQRSSANGGSGSKQPLSFFRPLWFQHFIFSPSSSLSVYWPQFVPFTGWLGHRDALIMVHSRSHHKAEWHSIAMEKLCRLCDWLPVNKEVSTAWGPLGQVRVDQRGGLWDRKGARCEEQTRAENGDLFISCRTQFKN